MSLALLLAALLRLGWPGINSFSFDESRVSHLALQMAREGRMAWVGMQSSAGPPNMPGFVWLMALLYALTTDPLVATLAIGAINLLAVAGLWWLARRAWGATPALGVLTVASASPYAALYARSIWSQDLLLPIAVAWALAVAWAVHSRSSVAVATHVALAGLAPQVHFAGLALLLATLWTLCRLRLARHWVGAVAGAGLAALAAIPYAYALLRRSPEALGLLREVAGASATWSAQGLLQSARLAAGWRWEWFLLGSGWHWPAAVAAGRDAAGLMVGLLAAAGWAMTLAQLRHSQGTAPPWREAVEATLPAWALAGPLLFARHTTPVHPQYLLACLPAAFLGVGAALARLRPKMQSLALALLVPCALAQALPVMYGLEVVATRLTPAGMGTPLLYPRAASRALRDGRPVVVHAHGDASEYLGDVAGFHVLFWGYPHRVVDGRSVLVWPAMPGDSAHLLATFPDLPAWEMALRFAPVGTITALPRRANEPAYMALTIEGGAPHGLEPVGPYHLANGARLVGRRVEAVDGERVRVISAWEVAEAPGEARYHLFHHLRDADEGEPLAIHDVPLSSTAWQMGDVVLAWAELPWPEQHAEPLWLEMGMYSWPDVSRVPVRDRPGDPLAPIRLELPER